MAVTGRNRSRPGLSPTWTFGNRRARSVLPAQTKPCGHRLANQRLNVRNAQPGNPVAEPADGPPGEATGNNSLKPIHGATHVQGNPVLSNPAPAPHANGRHFALIKPDPRQTGESLTSETQRSHYINHYLLQLTQIPMQIRAVAMEVQHGIDHKLTWTVMGHFPAAINAMEGCWRLLRIEEEMTFRSAAPKGVTGWMLQQPHRFCRRVAP